MIESQIGEARALEHNPLPAGLRTEGVEIAPGIVLREAAFDRDN